MSERLVPIEGMVPAPFNRPSGCPFHPRCDHRVRGICDTIVPDAIAVSPHQTTRCLMFDPRTQQHFPVKELSHE
jgi:peptide/nickel transport system ATP-binding protein